MMTPMNRRKFLRAAAAGLGAVTLNQFLAACSANETRTVSPTQAAQSPTSTARPPAAAPPTATRGVAATANSQPTSRPATDTPQPVTTTTTPDLVVARSGEPEEMVRRAIAALGGMERFVPAGSNVIVKPNICVAYHTYEYAATTNPWVVGALVKLCLEAGARSVRVMDFPFGGTAEEAYEISGIAEQVKAAGGEMVTMSNMKFVSMELPQAKSLKKSGVYDDALKTDVLIDVPIAKHHSLARLTLGMKNLMGVIRDRETIHAAMGARLTDLARQIHPAVTIVDAVRILVAHGPTGGSLNDVRTTNTIIASHDLVAADAYAAAKLFELQPAEVGYVKACAEMGLGTLDLSGLKVEETNV